jgi:hypothetical protein
MLGYLLGDGLYGVLAVAAVILVLGPGCLDPLPP